MEANYLERLANRMVLPQNLLHELVLRLLLFFENLIAHEQIFVYFLRLSVELGAAERSLCSDVSYIEKVPFSNWVKHNLALDRFQQNS